MATIMPNPETHPGLPSPPFIAMKAIPNFRDLGGYPIADSSSKSFRRNYIFRCGEPTKAVQEDIEKIQSLGITQIYDLRSRPEIEKHQVSTSDDDVVREPYVWEGVERIHAPVFPEQSWDPVSMAVRQAEFQREDAEGMVNAYKTIANEGAKSYGIIARRIIAQPPPGNGLIIHCTAGKDRTGVLGALLLQVAGVADNLIVEEYSLTNRGLGSWMDYLVSYIVKNTGASMEAAARMASAREDSMAAFLVWLRREGGAEVYFKEKCGLSDNEVEQMKNALIADVDPIVGIKK